MNVPEEFRRLALHMHQDIELLVHSDDELFAYLARVPKGRGRKIVTDFIDKLLASELTHDELADIWTKAGADWYLRDNSARPFLERLREAIVSSDS